MLDLPLDGASAAFSTLTLHFFTNPRVVCRLDGLLYRIGVESGVLVLPLDGVESGVLVLPLFGADSGVLVLRLDGAVLSVFLVPLDGATWLDVMDMRLLLGLWGLPAAWLTRPAPNTTGSGGGF